MTTWLAVAQVVTSLCAALAAVLAWAAKLWWGKEFAAAKEGQLAQKDETIKAKDAQLAAKDETIKQLQTQIEHYKELTPMKIREYFQSVTEQLGEYNTTLQEDLKKSEEQLALKERQIQKVSEQRAGDTVLIEQLERERDALAEQVKAQAKELRVVRDATGRSRSLSDAWSSFVTNPHRDLDLAPLLLASYYPIPQFTPESREELMTALKNLYGRIAEQQRREREQQEAEPEPGDSASGPADEGEQPPES